jgi:uncharacterized protein (DUF1697 family)
MTRYIALLRAVNVGGTGKLPMADLKALCAALGFGQIETYIASGNVVFDSDCNAADVRRKLGEKLHALAGKPIGVVMRTSVEMKVVLASNPFPNKPPNLTHTCFLNDAPPPGALDDIRECNGEEIRLGTREIFVHYPKGMGQSKLQIPAARAGTSRNMNTVAKLVELSTRS